MGLKRTDEFRQDAVRIALTSGLTLTQVMDVFGVSRSEARLAVALCDGMTLTAAAQTLGWTLETARSTSKRLFARIGVSGQPGVVRAMHASAIWLTTEINAP
jgi:DNA-binding CsgD family transcriptional regulator